MAAPFFPSTTPGWQNTYIPGYMGDGAAQERLLIGYGLNEDTVALNKWVTVIPSDKPKAYYPVFNSSDFVRLKNTTGNDRRWMDGTERPTAMQGVRFTNREFTLQRYGESTFIGDMAEDLSEIGSLITLNQEQLASRALVWRSILAAAVVTDPTKYFTTASPTTYDNYFATWTSMIATLCGASPKPYPTGYFGANLYAGTIAVPVVKRFLGHCIKEISRRTNGRVGEKDLLFLINPTTALKLAATEEFQAYLAQQSNSLAVLKGDNPEYTNGTFGLPNPLYSLKVVSDATTYTLGAPIEASTADADYGLQQYVIPDDFIAVLARPGSVAGMKNSRGFSAIALFQNTKRALKPTTFPDQRSQRFEVAVEDMFGVDMVAPDCAFAVGNANA